MAIECPSPAMIRRQHAERDVRDKYHARYLKLVSDMQAELDEIEKRFWNGEFNEARVTPLRKAAA